MMYPRLKKIHFVGIGGIGMSGIAEVLINLGYNVTGSDLKSSTTTEHLAGIGAKIFIGHREDNISDVDVTVISSAVHDDNPEVSESRRRKIPVIQRAEMLAELMRMKYGVAIGGSHGKTTTTSLVATILTRAGLDPTSVIGGKLHSSGTNAKLGRGDYLVAEADESDGSFLHLSPTIVAVTNIDLEHLDYYSGIDEIKGTFLKFINNIPFYGLAILCIDNENIQSIIPSVEKRFVTYGMTSQADYRASDIELTGMSSRFTVYLKNHFLGHITLSIAGAHNVYNALAAIAVANELEIDFSVIQEALAEFSGIQRRMQLRYDGPKVKIFDDYGHHPTEIKATLGAFRNAFPTRRIVVAFQPHRYSRTVGLVEQFATAFNDSDRLYIADIYAAGEKPVEGVSGQTVADKVRAFGHRSVSYIPKLGDLALAIGQDTRDGDIVISLGAGDITNLANELGPVIGAQGL